ncbi:MAG: 16S rRNA (guanine(527)-N(7))-methyltransferase RsmG [Lachnospirales bacterium]
MNKEFLRNCINDLQMNIEVSDESLNKFEKYFYLLIEKNKHMNLTAITEEKEVIIKHFCDSISLLKAYDFKDRDKVIDVGTGAGFPSIPLKILLPNVHFTLVDSLNKRVKFLDEVIELLELKNIETVHSRVEDLAKDEQYRENYDICVARAVANFRVLSEFCSPFIRVDGKFIALKGRAYEDEIFDAKNAFSETKLEFEKVVSVVLPTTEIKHFIVSLRKISNISTKYPRKAGIVTKKPL